MGKIWRSGASMAEPHLRYPMGRGEAAMMVPHTTGYFSLDKDQHSAKTANPLSTFSSSSNTSKNISEVLYGVYIFLMASKVEAVRFLLPFPKRFLKC